MKKPYAVFAFDQYYRRGGWNDFKAAFETKQEAEVFAAEMQKHHDCVEIVNLADDVSYEEAEF